MSAPLHTAILPGSIRMLETPEVCELTLGWINEQLRLEVDRRRQLRLRSQQSFHDNVWQCLNYVAAASGWFTFITMW